MSSTYQPRFVAYARSQGMTPDEVLARDKEKWPGACMAGFIEWIRDKWAEFDKAKGRKTGGPHWEHEEFDRFLGIA